LRGRGGPIPYICAAMTRSPYFAALRSMMRIRTCAALLPLWLAATLQAQPLDGLVAYYSFDACDAREDTGSGADGIIMGNAACGCGVQSNGLRLDGNTSVQILADFDVLFTAD